MIDTFSMHNISGNNENFQCIYATVLKHHVHQHGHIVRQTCYAVKTKGEPVSLTYTLTNTNLITESVESGFVDVHLKVKKKRKEKKRSTAKVKYTIPIQNNVCFCKLIPHFQISLIMTILKVMSKLSLK